MPYDNPPIPPPLPGESETAACARKTRWQFSLRSMMLLMTGTAIAFGLLSTMPIVNGIVLGGFWLVASGWLLTGIVFATGDQKAFCIGAMIVVASTWTGMGGMLLESAQSLAFNIGVPVSGWFGIWLKHLVLLASAVGNGWICIRARRYYSQPNC